jgi:paraquat-inducible protein B
MSRRASPTAIGAFVLGALALVVAGILVFGSGRFFRTPVTYVLFFNTSVQGLTVGAPVNFRGVKVGQVSRIVSRWDTSWIEVFIALDPSVPRGAKDKGLRESIDENIRLAGLRAQLRTQSFVTGQLYIALDLFPETALTLVGLESDVPEMPTVPTILEQFSRRAERLMETLESLPIGRLVESTMQTLEGLNTLVRSEDAYAALRETGGLLADARGLMQRWEREAGPLAVSVQETLQTARTAMTDVAQDARRAAGQVEAQGGALTASAQETLQTARTAMTEVAQDARRLLHRLEADAAALDALLGETRQSVQRIAGEVAPLLATIRGVAEEARAVVGEARNTLETVHGTMDEETPLGAGVGQAMRELGAASRSIRALTEYLERHPEALLQGKGAREKTDAQP